MWEESSESEPSDDEASRNQMTSSAPDVVVGDSEVTTTTEVKEKGQKDDVPSDEEMKEDVKTSEKDSEEESSSDDEGEKDSDYVESGKEAPDSEDNQEEGGESRESTASPSTESNSDSSSRPRKKLSGRGRIDDKTIKLLEEGDFLRRSSRARTSAVTSKNDFFASASARSSRSSNKPTQSTRSDSEDSEDSWSDDSPKRRGKAKGKKPAGKAKKALISSYRTARKPGQKTVDYKEKDTDEDLDSDDIIEWDEPRTPAEASASTSGQETIERVIKHRTGVTGATGSATTCYNVAEKGDPNENKEQKQLEKQYFIKWVGWSHLHNTWESEASLNTMGANGIKKLQNYIKRMTEVDEWKRTADKEYIEYFECEQVMAEELFEQYKGVERIVAHQVSRERNSDGDENTEYFIKWSGLPYADCTWEESRLLPDEKIAEYHDRIENSKAPIRNAAYLKRRPKFVKLDEQPDYLKPNGGMAGDRELELRDYQLEGLNWTTHAWCKGNSCILADEMGLGKTIQSISFLSTLYHRYDLYGPFLVVVPLSTMAAWQKEFSQWAPDLNVIIYMGDVTSRNLIRQYEWYVPGSKNKIKINVALTTYEILLKDKPFLSSFDWTALLVDEAHRLKNDESLLYKCLTQFNCNHRLLITGTPLQNSLKELWALLHFIMPEKFDCWEEFENDHNDKDHKGISALHKKLEPFLLRRVKKDVEKSLPPKLEQILRVDMTAVQKQYYKWILTKNYKELSKGVKGSINGFVNLIMELKKCCNHSSLVRSYDEYENDPHARLQQLLKSSGKLILLDKLLCRLKETGHRVLIFSQMVMMLDIVQEYLQLRRFNTQRLDGTMRADLRKQAMDHFNAEGSSDFCFLLSTRAGGLGINLATADTVIIFDSDWNPQNDLQAMSRAHRIGQTKQVNIYRLVTKGSVEEEIVERAKRKLVLDHLVIQRMDTTGRTVLSKSSAPGGSTGSVPFDKSELNAILKFGAAELFKEKEGEEQEPEVDIDRILMGAETREAEESQENGNELLNSFKYANFVIDEEKDVAEAAANNHVGSQNDWDDIIPEDERRKVDEEERRKALAEINLAPRQRTKPSGVAPGRDEEDGDNEESSSDDEAETGKKKRKKAWGDFSSTEVRRFVRSFRKFAHPLKRLEALAQDAELEEHSTEELKKLVEALLDGCSKAEDEKIKEDEEKKEEKKDGEKEKVRDRGVIFKFAGADVNVRTIRKMHTELEPLDEAMKGAGEKMKDFKGPNKVRPLKGWDVEWTHPDDVALLKGVYKYGMGSWDSIKMDPELGLADKILLNDKVKKPQPRHLQGRVEYLLKLMIKSENNNSVRKEPNKKKAKERKRKANENEKEKDGPPEKKKKEKAKEKEKASKSKSNNHKEKKHSADKSLSDQLSLISIDKSTYEPHLESKEDKPFKECVKMMRPVHKYIKRLKEADEEKNEKELSKAILRLGDNFRGQLSELMEKKPKTNLRKWYNYLWIFVCKFVQREPAELLGMYRNIEKHKHHHEKEHHKKEKEKEKEHRKEKEHHKKDKPRDKDREKKEHKEKEREKEKDHFTPSRAVALNSEMEKRLPSHSQNYQNKDKDFQHRKWNSYQGSSSSSNTPNHQHHRFGAGGQNQGGSFQRHRSGGFHHHGQNQGPPSVHRPFSNPAQPNTTQSQGSANFTPMPTRTPNSATFTSPPRQPLLAAPPSIPSQIYTNQAPSTHLPPPPRAPTIPPAQTQSQGRFDDYRNNTRNLY